jgi:hypothetical protein
MIESRKKFGRRITHNPHGNFKRLGDLIQGHVIQGQRIIIIQDSIGK